MKLSRARLWSPFPLATLPDELLSSYLCRAAARQGTTPQAFCSLYFDTGVWSRDMDRTPPAGLVDALAGAAPLPRTTVLSMVLDGPKAWISQIGVYHRERRLYGMRYCPQCLGESGCLKRQWRYSWAVACCTHGVTLLDACWCCQASLAPHRSTSLLRCNVCRADLTAAPRTPADPARLLWLRQLTAAICEGDMLTGHAELSGVSMLHGAWCVEAALRATRTGHVLQIPQSASQVLDLPSAVRSRMSASQSRLDFMRWLFHAWPDSFQQLAGDCDWSREVFSQSCTPVPGWLAREAALLRPKCARVESRTRWRNLRNRMTELYRRKQPGWRAQRAALLAGAVEGRRGH